MLKYRPDDAHARRDLINLYRIKYKDHSQFEQFMKLSKLANYKTPVKYAIQDFEKNIVFDKGNYAFHNTWKLGKIVDMDSENIVINFAEKPEHKMSIQMALQSLTPIPKDHLYVMQYEDPEYVKNLFKDEFMQFFEILIKSYGGKILLEDIKRELIPALCLRKGMVEVVEQGADQDQEGSALRLFRKEKRPDLHPGQAGNLRRGIAGELHRVRILQQEARYSPWSLSTTSKKMRGFRSCPISSITSPRR